MDGAELTPTPTTLGMNAAHHVARPTLGFPLGTALLLIIIFCLSGIFSCCYHWEKLRSLRRRGRNPHPTQQLPVASTAAAQQHLQFASPAPLSPSKPTFQPQDLKKESEQSLPVIMAGDQYPKFMAWPCPCPCPCQPTSNVSVPASGGGGGGGMTVITVGVLLVPSVPLCSSPSSSPSTQHPVN